jgi:beta-mannosidase
MQEFIIKDNWFLLRAESCDEAKRKAYKIDIENETDGWISIKKMPAQVQDVITDYGEKDKLWLPGKVEEYKWIAESDWLYKTKFSIEHISNKRVFINFLGLDTVADIYLNGKLMLETSDMYIPHIVDVSDQLQEENLLVIHFHSPYEYIDSLKMPLEWEGKFPKHYLLRKMPHDYGTYLGPNPYFTRIGVFRDVIVEIYDSISIDYVDVNTKLSDDYQNAVIQISASGVSTQRDVKLKALLYDPNNTLISSQEKMSKVSSQYCIDFNFNISKPQLWWPRNAGNQNLYEVILHVYDQESNISIQSIRKQIGIRNISVDETLKFYINGRHIKLWGACIAPIDHTTLCWNQERVNTLLDMAEHSNMNTLRVWAECGPLEDEFYQEADRRGLVIWQDFWTNDMLPNSEYYKTIFEKEVTYQVKRLKHHACIALWCGGNESIMWHEVRDNKFDFIGFDILDEVFRNACSKYDSDRYYHINSPAFGKFPNDPANGDTHGYTSTMFVPGYKFPNFVSEDTRISAPPLKAIKRFFRKEDIWPAKYNPVFTHESEYIWPEEWNNYTAFFGWKKTGPIEKFYDVTDAQSLIYRLGAAEALYYKELIEKQRRGRPSYSKDDCRLSNGYLYWKLNDSWPQIYSSKIGYFLETYITYYVIKRAYEPVMISFDVTDHINCWIVNDSIKKIEGFLKIKLFNLENNSTKKELICSIKVDPGKSNMITRLEEFGQFTKTHILYAELIDGIGQKVARSNDIVDMERNIKFPDAKLTMEIINNEIVINTDKFAKCIHIDGISNNGDEFGWLFEDNYFDLLPFEEKHIKIITNHGIGRIFAKPYYSQYQTEVEYSQNCQKFSN